MTAPLFNRYIWLADTIYGAGHITLDDINRRWARSQYNNEHEDGIPERTFHRHKEAILSIFGIEIKCDRTDKTYYIANADDIEQGGVRKWLVNTFAVNNLINESHQLKRRILFEEIPSGQHFLTPIIEAMRDEHTIELTYRNFRKDKSFTFEIEPFCVKVFKQRWYLVARSVSDEQIRIYGLDRIEAMRLAEKSFRLPSDFDAQEFFADSFGIIVDEEYDVERVRIRVDNRQRNYLRSLPLHPTQNEIERMPDFSVFEFRLRPTFDFQQELRTHGAAVEVLSPEWLRNEFAEEAERTASMYTNQPAAIDTNHKE